MIASLDPSLTRSRELLTLGNPLTYKVELRGVRDIELPYYIGGGYRSITAV